MAGEVITLEEVINHVTIYGGKDEKGNPIPFEDVVRMMDNAEKGKVQIAGEKVIECASVAVGGLYNVITSDTTQKIAKGTASAVGTASWFLGKTAYAGASSAAGVFWNYWFPSREQRAIDALKKLTPGQRELVMKLIDGKDQSAEEVLLLLASKN